MPSGLYDSFRELAAGGDIDLLNDDIRVIGIDATDYAVNFATHDFLNDVAAGARVRVSAALAGKSIADGIFNHAQGTLPAAAGDDIDALLYYKHTGADATAPLIGYFDNFAGLPVPSVAGSDIKFTPSTGANKLFRI